MHEALALVKRELGQQAVILGTRSSPRAGLGGLVGRSFVEITAVPADTPGVRAPRVSQARCGTAAPALPGDVLPYYQRLVEQEVAEELATRLVQEAARLARQRRISGQTALQELLRETIAATIPVTGGIRLVPGATRRVALVGPAGSGKTTTLAKLAAHFALRCRRRVAIVSLDLQRLDANDQLRRYAEIIGVPMHAAQTVAEVKEALRALHAVDLVLIDTHGVCAGNRGHFVRLAALLRAARPDEVHLVLPASMLPSVHARLAAHFAPLGVSQVVLTRLDEAVGAGVILNAVAKLNWGLSYVTTGESIPNNIEEACPQRLVALLFPSAD